MWHTYNYGGIGLRNKRPEDLDMTGQIDEFMKNAPPAIRERLASMDPETRLRMIENRRKMMESMDDNARSHMQHAMTSMRGRSIGPELGSMAPDFYLAIWHRHARLCRWGREIA